MLIYDIIDLVKIQMHFDSFTYFNKKEDL
jgi:hypothetical protein